MSSGDHKLAMKKIKYTLVFSLFLLINVYSQKLEGTVDDTNNSSIPNSIVGLTNKKTNFKSITKTDSKGKFSFRELKNGNYILSVEADGFNKSIQTINFNSSQSIKIILQPMNIAEVVSVTSNYLAGSNAALERTPGAIQVISKRELESARVFNFAEALRKVSGINIRNEEGFGLRPNISIRGSDPTRSRKVLLLEDGIPLSYAPYGDNSSYYHPPIERFEAVEVLKGSGQIEYGPVTVAGIVNYLTPSPTEKNEFSLKLIGGNRDYFNGNIGFSGTLANTGIVLNFTRKQGEGSRDNLRAGVNDFSAKVVRSLNDNNIFKLKYSHFDESSQLTYTGLTEAEFAQNPKQNPFINDDLQFFREGFSLSHTGVFTSKASLTTNFYTSYFSRDWWRQSSNSDERPNRLGSDPDCLSLSDLNTTCGNQGTPRDFRTIGIEPRFNFQFETGGVRNNLDTGIRLHYETQNRRKWNGFTPNARESGSEITERNLRNTLAVSAFIQNRFVWKDFSITPGLRIENVNYERTNLLNNSNARTDLTQLIPGLGIAYNLFNKVTVFGGVHRGFAPPGTSDILTNNGGVVELDSELSWNYEIGVRMRPTDFINVETAFFRNDYENQIIPASVAGGVGSTQTNAGKTIQQGFEVNGRFDSNRLFQTQYNLYFQTAYTLLEKAQFNSLRFSGVSGFEDVLINGNRLPYTPRHLATTSIGYSYRDFDGFIENIYVGKQFSDDLNTVNPIPNGQRGIIGSQIYFNATVNYQLENLNSTIFFTTKNIFDRLFIVDRTRGIYPSSPRLIQFGWKWNFSK
jgi:Fe(3+) dicitrate transport protein